MSLDERRKDEELKVERITNKNLICNKCLYKLDDSKVYGNTSRCALYDYKPYTVFNEKSSCKDFYKE